MPANGEKQPRWLMVCKCGARVKASRCGARTTYFSADPTPIRNTVHKKSGLDSRLLGEPSPIDRQDCCGTIEVWSNADIIIAGADERRSPGRWNNIRRSNALERKNG